MRVLVALVGVALAVAGCSADLSDVPVPSKVHGPTYEIGAVFDSALNLPERAPVKIDGRVVGEVVSVEAVDYTAHVRLRLMTGTQLPVGTRAQVRLSAPVGEAFVALDPPSTTLPAIAPGGVIPIDATATAPDTTDLLTSLSVAVTGGSYADLKVVVDELVLVMDGSSGPIRHLLGQLDTLVTTANAHRDDLDSALDAMDRLSARLAADTDSITTSVQRLTPAVQRLARREDAAMRLLTSMARLSDRSTTVVTGLRRTLGRQLEDARVVLDEVIREQDRLGPLLTGITAFSNGLDAATPGDFANFDLTASLNVHLAPGVDLPPAVPGSTDGQTSGRDLLLPDLIGGLLPEAGPSGLLGSLLGPAAPDGAR